MSDGYDLQRAKRIDRDRLQLLTSKFAQDVAEETKASERLLASKGMANSGAAIRQFVDIRVAAMNQLITDAVAPRKEMIDRAPGLATAYELGNLQKKLDEYVDGIRHAVKSLVTLNPRGGGRLSVLSALPDYGAGLKQKIKTKLKTLENECKLPKREAAGPSTSTPVTAPTWRSGTCQTVFSRLCGAAVTVNSKCGMTEQLEFGLGEKRAPAKWPYPVCSYVTRHSEDELNSDAKDSPRRNGVR